MHYLNVFVTNHLKYFKTMTFVDTWEKLFTIGAYTLCTLMIVAVLGGLYATIEQFKNGQRYLRYFIFTIVLFLLSCAPQKHYVSKPVKKKHHSEMRGLMLLENTQLGRNKYFWSHANQRRIKSYYKRHK